MMHQDEAVAIATEYVKTQQIPTLGIERVFFVPLAAFDYQPPGLTDSWVIHFRLPPPNEDQIDLTLSSDPNILIVRVNTETHAPSIFSSL
jgi:hypothetical protein